MTFFKAPDNHVVIVSQTFFEGTSESSLRIQVRTTRVGDVNATGFTAVVVQEGNGDIVQANFRSPGTL